MRRLVAWNLMTLDGYFEGEKKWDLSFHERAWGPELERFSLEQSREVGTLLFGRVTYEGMAAYWKSEKGPIADFMNETEKVVVSRTLKDMDWANSRLMSGDLRAETAALKQTDGRDIYVFGSAALLASLLGYGLVDEYRICIVPVVLGSGNPLFKHGAAPTGMTLAKSRQLSANALVLYCTPQSAGEPGDKRPESDRTLPRRRQQ